MYAKTQADLPAVVFGALSRMLTNAGNGGGIPSEYIY